MLSDREILGLPLEGRLTGKQVKNAFLAMAKLKHPDAGGTHEDFILIRQAFQRLSLDKGTSIGGQPMVLPCQQCGGSGKKWFCTNGFESIVRPCKKCRGTGSVKVYRQK